MPDLEDVFASAAIFARLYAGMVVEDPETINRAIVDMGLRGEHALLSTAQVLCEMILDAQGPCGCGGDCGPKMPGFRLNSTGERKTVEDVPVHVARAGQMVAAVANNDEENTVAIFKASIADGEDMITGVMSSLVVNATKALKIINARNGV